MEYQIGFKTLTKWYHRQFIETAEKRFVHRTARIISLYVINNIQHVLFVFRYLQPQTKVLMHSNMADYFIGTWYDVIKPISFTKRKKATYSKATRGVPDMPCMFEKNAYNYRKLYELPAHLTECSRHIDFVTSVCYDFDVSETWIRFFSRKRSEKFSNLEYKMLGCAKVFYLK